MSAATSSAGSRSSWLFFRAELHPALGIGQLDLPVEIRDGDLRVIARSSVRSPVLVEPGSYYVVTRLPGGQELRGTVHVRAGHSAVVDLAPSAEDRSPSETEELVRYVWGHTPGPTPAGVVPPQIERARAQLVAFVREPSGYVAVGPPRIQETTRAGDALRISVHPEEVDLVQLAQPGDTTVNVVLPNAAVLGREPGRGYEIVLAPATDDSVDIAVHLKHGHADALLQYAYRGLLPEAAQLASSSEMAEELLLRKYRNPLAAAAGALILLRLGELDRLHDWTENLYNGFPALPDAAAIRAEHLARLGRPTEALARLLSVDERGLPVFSDSLSYAVHRLLPNVAGRRRLAEPGLFHRAETLLERLTRYAAATDFDRAFTTFTGLDPNDPQPTARYATAPNGGETNSVSGRALADEEA